MPVLVLNGDLDANTPSASGRDAAAQFPNATFVEIAGAGHTPAVSPEGMEMILTFIAEGGSSRSSSCQIACHPGQSARGGTLGATRAHRPGRPEVCA